MARVAMRTSDETQTRTFAAAAAAAELLLLSLLLLLLADALGNATAALMLDAAAIAALVVNKAGPDPPLLASADVGVVPKRVSRQNIRTKPLLPPVMTQDPSSVAVSARMASPVAMMPRRVRADVRPLPLSE